MAAVASMKSDKLLGVGWVPLQGYKVGSRVRIATVVSSLLMNMELGTDFSRMHSNPQG